MNLLAFLLPLLIGLVILLLVSTRLGHAWMLIWLAPGVGIGVSSVLFFLWSLLFYPRFQPLLYSGLEAALLMGLTVLLWWQRRHVDLRFSLPRIGWAEGLLAAALSAGLVFFVYWFLRHTSENPLGSWDAWTLWNSRARYLLFGDQNTWRNVFSTQVNHSDYPYLLTGFIARCWVMIGKDRAYVPALTAGLFTVSTVGLLGSVVTRFRGLGSGMLTILLLVSLPLFAWTAASQYADLPLACYYLATLVFLYLYFTGDQKWPALTAAGAGAGFALWTKNEGASFAVAFLAVLTVTLLTRQSAGWRGLTERLRVALARLLPGLAGLLPVLTIYLAYRTWLVPPTDLFEQRQASELLQLISDPSRYQRIALAISRIIRRWSDWYLPYLPSLFFYTLVVGLQPLKQGEQTAIRVLSTVLGLTFIQYLGVYLITPHDLAWHLSTSFARLLNQLLPGFLLIIFLSTRSAFEPKTS